VEVPLGAIFAGAKDLTIAGGATTVRGAEAVSPVRGKNVPLPSSKEAVTLPVVLFFAPPLVPVTLMKKEHEVDGVKVNPVMPIVLPPGLAITLPVTLALGLAQPLGRPLAAATTNPLGRGSLNEILVNVALLLGLLMVKVSVVVPFCEMLAAPKALARVGATGAGVTVRAAVLLVAPGPLSLAEIGPVVLLKVPVVVACTVTEMKHDPLAAGCLPLPWGCDASLDPLVRRLNPLAGLKLPPARLRDEEPGTAVTIPPQSLLKLLDDAIANPAGNASVNAIPVNVTSLSGGVLPLFGLVMVKLNKDVPFWTVVSGKKSLLIVGGLATARFADAVFPVPPLVELTGPVAFK